MKAQLTRIAGEASRHDGALTDFPEGLFRAVHENEQLPHQLWLIGGMLYTRNSRPRFVSPAPNDVD